MAILISAFCIAAISCRKNAGLDNPAFRNCHFENPLDSTGIWNKLIGTWSMRQQFCAGVPALPIRFNVKVSFHPGGSFLVTDTHGPLTSGTWQLAVLGPDTWGLSLNPTSEYLSGRIMFCNREVLFDGTFGTGVGCETRFFK